MTKFTLNTLRTRNLFDVLFERTNLETERGMVIIVAAIMEDYLSEFIKMRLPFDSKRKIKTLFDYPGILSSFSSKIEMSYCFGLISENIYTSLSVLRKMRNECAHSTNDFNLNEWTQQLTEINNLGEGISDYIKHRSWDIHITTKLTKLKEDLIEEGINIEQNRDIIIEGLSNKDYLKALKRQALTLELLIGLVHIGALIEHEFKRSSDEEE